MIYPCLSSLLESRMTLRIKHSHEEQFRAYSISCEIKTFIGRLRWHIFFTTRELKVCVMEIEILTFVISGSVRLTVPPYR